MDDDGFWACLFIGSFMTSYVTFVGLGGLVFGGWGAVMMAGVGIPLSIILSATLITYLS